jgi:hypothetical protein
LAASDFGDCCSNTDENSEEILCKFVCGYDGTVTGNLGGGALLLNDLEDNGLGNDCDC